MKAFWWFKEGAIAGMARPGFNRVHWFDLPFEEASIFGWLGQHSSSEVPLESFRSHLHTYVPKIFRFYGLSESEGQGRIRRLGDPEYFSQTLSQLNARTHSFRESRIRGDNLHLEINHSRLREERDFLKSQGIRRVVALTEHHHDRDELKDHFSLEHIAIEDLGAPHAGQVHVLAAILREATRREERLAVHCLAGIGRTSTMLLAAHLTLGEPLDGLKARLAERNPFYQLTGAQAAFIEEFKSTLPGP